MNQSKRTLSIFLSCLLVLATFPGGLAHAADEPTPPTPVASAQPTPQPLQQLVAPIALYPDSLVAQILAASTYPDQVVEADRWLQAHPDLKGDQLGQSVDQQSWDPSVKALTEFPSVLANMDKNLSWTSSLGDTYINHQQDVMNAVQVMRQNAKKAGNLKSTPQLNVSQQGQTIVIQPANPEVVYVPEYDSAVLAGDGITGLQTGTIAGLFSITTRTFPTAEPSSTAITTLIARARTSIAMAAGFTAEIYSTAAPSPSMVSWGRASEAAVTPAPLAASIMVA